MTRAEIGAMSPFLVVGDVGASLAFYRDALGFDILLRQPVDNPFLGIVQRGGAMLFVKSEAGVPPMPNPERHPHLRWDAYAHVPDPDALAAEFAGRGVAFRMPLTDTADGLRGFEVADPDGHVLFFGRPR